MRALEREGWVWIKGEGVVWSLLRATLKHNSRALHWRGWWEVWWGWDLRQALLKELPLRLSKVATTCRGVSCVWPLLWANPKDCFNTEAAPTVRVCCNAQTPERITWPNTTPLITPFCYYWTLVFFFLSFSFSPNTILSFSLYIWLWNVEAFFCFIPKGTWNL